MQGEVIALCILAAGWLTAVVWIAWVLLKHLRKRKGVEGGSRSINRNLESSL